MTIKNEISLKKEQMEWKAKQIGFRIKQKLKDTTNWCIQHPRETVVIVSAAASGLRLADSYYGKYVQSKKVNARTKQLKEELMLKDLRIYDRSLGAYYSLTRPLSNSEKILIKNLKNKGLDMAEILSEMDVLA